MTRLRSRARNLQAICPPASFTPSAARLASRAQAHWINRLSYAPHCSGVKPSAAASCGNLVCYGRSGRIPGRLANVGIWSTPTANELHDALTSLPVWRHAEISVTALSDHPLNASPGDQPG